jgi:hypothetical protein
MKPSASPEEWDIIRAALEPFWEADGITIEQATDTLLGAGLGSIFDRHLRRFQLALTRGFIERLSKEAIDEGRPRERVDSYIKTLNDGTQHRIYKRFNRTTAREKADFANRQHAIVGRESNKLCDYVTQSYEEHGRAFQRLCNFMIDPFIRNRETSNE